MRAWRLCVCVYQYQCTLPSGAREGISGGGRRGEKEQGDTHVPPGVLCVVTGHAGWLFRVERIHHTPRQHQIDSFIIVYHGFLFAAGEERWRRPL